MNDENQVSARRSKIRGSKPIIARHETFHPRFGWLKKGFDSTVRDAKVFLSPNAGVELGVGKNMVNAIRYWCHAFKILETVTTEADPAEGSTATAFGRAMFADDGWDPYLESTSGLWLLHWNLLQQRCIATSWHFTFNVYPNLDFAPTELAAGLQSYLQRDFPKARVVLASLRKDVSCLLRMYAGTDRDLGKSSEESISCPFVDLGLIHRIDNARFAFNVGHKPTLPSKVLLACCLDFAARTESQPRSISLRRLLRHPASPGVVFKITESNLCDAIEEVGAEIREIRLADTAGVTQFSYKNDPSELAHCLLQMHFVPHGT